MAINHTQLWADISAIYSAILDIETSIADLNTNRDLIVTSLEASGATAIIPGVISVFTNAVSNHHGLINQLINVIRARLLERETVIEELPLLPGSSSFDEVMDALIADMQNQSKTLKKSTVTFGAVTKTVVNTGAGDIIRSTLLSGILDPGEGMTTSRHLAGVNQEMSTTDAVVIECISDDQQDTVGGGEVFLVHGKTPQRAYPFDDNDYGNVGTLSLSVGGSNLIEDIESFATADIPDGWELATGVAGTDFGEENTTVMLGDASIFFFDSGSITRDIKSDLSPGQHLCWYFYARKATGATGDMNFKVYVDDTELSAYSITLDETDLSDSAWTLFYLEFIVPDVIGEGASYLEIEGVSIATANFFLDNMVLTEFDYWAGAGFVLTQGTQRFILGDKFEFTYTNDEAGKLQRCIARSFGRQMPSDSPGNISDPA